MQQTLRACGALGDRALPSDHVCGALGDRALPSAHVCGALGDRALPFRSCGNRVEDEIEDDGRVGAQ